MKCGALNLSVTGFNLNWISGSHILIYLVVVTIHYDQRTRHGDLYQKGTMQICPVKL